MISSILLSAGLSTRMGQPKALLDWGGEPLIVSQVRNLLEAGADEVVVVLGYKADDISRKLNVVQCRIMLNPRFQMGRAGSLRIGAKAANREADAIIILNVDQPRSAEEIRAVLEAHKEGGKLITRPDYEGRGGHPVVVSGKLRTELMEATDDEDGLRGVLSRHSNEILDVPGGAEYRLDINTPDEYEAVRPASAPAGT